MLKQSSLRFKKTIQSETKQITLNVDHDQLYAYLTIIPSSKGDIFEVRQIYEMLDTEGILNGVRKGVISDLIARVNDTMVPIREEVIAVGTPVKPGVDARIEYHFKVSETIELSTSEDGKVNHRELNLINNVQQGDLLAERIPGVEPVAGVDIYGKPIIPEKIKDARLVAGKNVELRDDDMKAYSAIDGQAFLKNKVIQVSPILTISHDVDLNVGNLTFNGTIMVTGNVLSGFTLKAKEDIHIQGTVEGANLVAGGNITISGGLKGQGKALVQCRGDITVSFAERATIECHGTLRVQSSIINSDVTCYSILEAITGKGSIVGGDIRAIGGIQCLEAGSKLGVPTKLTVGDKFIIKERLSSVVQDQNALKEQLKGFNQKFHENKAIFERLESLPPEKQEPLREILENIALLNQQIQELDVKQEKLNVLYRKKCESTVKIKKSTHPNVIIYIGHSHLDVKTHYQNAIFSENHVLNAVKIGCLD